jgi:natural product precursor
MKKLKLNLQQFEGAEVLTRSQLKKILGGDTGSGDGCSTEACGTSLPNDCGDVGCQCINGDLGLGDGGWCQKGYA